MLTATILTLMKCFSIGGVGIKALPTLKASAQDPESHWRLFLNALTLSATHIIQKGHMQASTKIHNHQKSNHACNDYKLVVTIPWDLK